jgi:hypothetical protein
VQVNRKWSPGARMPHVSIYDGPQWETKVNIFKVFSILVISEVSGTNDMRANQ